MKRKLSIALLLLGCYVGASAQISIGIGRGFGGFGRFGYGMGYGRNYNRSNARPNRNTKDTLPAFKPTINFSIGYGFPNLDKNQFTEFYTYYKGNTSQSGGPVVATLDYRFSRNMSIGIIATHGKTTQNYYDYNSTATSSPSLTGKLESWSVMADLINYIPVNTTVVSPYLRTAVGINFWNQSFTDGLGNKLNYVNNPSDLAYQISLGAILHITPNAGLFVEGGYGKYIVEGGLAFRF